MLGKRSTCISREGLQFVRPLFEFSSACAGCGEAPYLKLLSQLFGDRLQIANATGCSSIYGGNLPSLPWRAGSDGRGPAWSNSLFEDNAEFGLGMRLAVDQQAAMARALVAYIGRSHRAAPCSRDTRRAPAHRQRDRRAARPRRLNCGARSGMRRMRRRAICLPWPSIWCAGACGSWAATDGPTTSVPEGSITCWPRTAMSTSWCSIRRSIPTPAASLPRRRRFGASAKFAAAGKRTPRKDLALQAIAYGYVYVAQVALGGSPEQTIQAMRDAEAYDGPSLILAYSHCIAHGFDMRDGMKQQHRAVASGYWPLFRFDPTMRQADMNPFRLDSTRPRIAVEDFVYQENRYRILTQTRPEEARDAAARGPSRRR